MFAWLQTKALTLLAAAIPIGLLASMGYQFLKKLVEKETSLLDKVPPALHRVFFSLTAVALTAGAAALGITLECPDNASCLAAVTQEQLKVALEAVLAIAVGAAAHHLKKKVGA